MIIGHGLAGCVLALTLYRKGIPFRLFGKTLPGEASKASSGLINPVTGRKYVKSWMIDEFIPAALDFYNWSETLFGGSYFLPVEIIRFLSHPEAINAWKTRQEDAAYAPYISAKRYEVLDLMEKPYGVITGAFQLDTPGWLQAARDHLRSEGLLEESLVDDKDFSSDEIIIYANGAYGQSLSNGLIPNKGEALMVRLPEWKIPAIVKDDVYFIPQVEGTLFWVGSNYEPWPTDPNPTATGKEFLMNAVGNFYTGAFVVEGHLAGIRPTTDDRRPLVGPIGGTRTRYLFNGMGTKGTSLAPYWADRLSAHLWDDSPLPKIVMPDRY